MQRLLIDSCKTIPSDIFPELLQEAEEMIHQLPNSLSSKRPREARNMRFYAVLEDTDGDEFPLLSASINWLNASPSPDMGGTWSKNTFYSAAEGVYYMLAMLWW